MLQMYKYRNGSLNSDQIVFAKFLENHINRIMYNLKQYNISTFDGKLASNTLIALSEYYFAVYGTPAYGRYELQLPDDSNTSTVFDDKTTQSDIYIMMDAAQVKIQNTQFRSNDWRDGIFIDNAVTGDWNAWGELQIYALSKIYKLKRNIGQTPTQLNGLLDIITYSADRFYGTQAYHYADSTNNYSRTKERITSISGWAAKFHTNDDQFNYQNSSIAVGLKELAEAYYMSQRSDIYAKRLQYLNYSKIVASWFIGNNNVQTEIYDGTAGNGSFDGRGAVFDGIKIINSIPVRKNDAGAESSAEGLWTMIVVKKAISDYGLSTTFSFNY